MKISEELKVSEILPDYTCISMAGAKEPVTFSAALMLPLVMVFDKISFTFTEAISLIGIPI